MSTHELAHVDAYASTGSSPPELELDEDLVLKAAAYHGGLVLPPRRWPKRRGLTRTSSDSQRRARLRDAYVGENPTSVSLAVELGGEVYAECAYCGARDDLAVDHVHPLGLQWLVVSDDYHADNFFVGKVLVPLGLHEHENCVLACRSCNSSKGNRPLTKWWRS